MEPLDTKELLTKEDIDNLVKEYYEIDKQINKYWKRFVCNINLSNEHYRMVQTQYFIMLVYKQTLRMQIEDYGIEV